MLGGIGTLLNIILGKPAQTLVKTIFGDKAQRELSTAAADQSIQDGFQAEFGPRENRTWWDSFVDGLNRIIRPFMTFGVIGLFVWAVMEPTKFAIAMSALQHVPNMLWYIFMTIIGFWFGTKMLEKAPKEFKGPSIEAIRKIAALEVEQRMLKQKKVTTKRKVKNV
jgi:hypothetical protein